MFNYFRILNYLSFNNFSFILSLRYNNAQYKNECISEYCSYYSYYKKLHY